MQEVPFFSTDPVWRIRRICGFSCCALSHGLITAGDEEGRSCASTGTVHAISARAPGHSLEVGHVITREYVSTALLVVLHVQYRTVAAIDCRLAYQQRRAQAPKGANSGSQINVMAYQGVLDLFYAAGVCEMIKAPLLQRHALTAILQASEADKALRPPDHARTHVEDAALFRFLFF